MKLLVMEKDCDNRKRQCAIKSALRLSQNERLPVYLQIGNVMRKILPWHNEGEINEKFNVTIEGLWDG
jgi:hypothetical protein